MSREKALLAARLLTRIESLELQLEEMHNLPRVTADILSNKKESDYPLLYEMALEIYEREDIEDFKKIIETKLKDVIKKLEVL